MVLRVKALRKEIIERERDPVCAQITTLAANGNEGGSLSYLWSLRLGRLNLDAVILQIPVNVDGIGDEP